MDLHCKEFLGRGIDLSTSFLHRRACFRDSREFLFRSSDYLRISLRNRLRHQTWAYPGHAFVHLVCILSTSAHYCLLLSSKPKQDSICWNFYLRLEYCYEHQCVFLVVNVGYFVVYLLVFLGEERKIAICLRVVDDLSVVCFLWCFCFSMGVWYPESMRKCFRFENKPSNSWHSGCFVLVC